MAIASTGDDVHSRRLEISRVTHDHGHAVHQCRRRDEFVALAAPVWSMQAGAALRRSGIDRPPSYRELEWRERGDGQR